MTKMIDGIVENRQEIPLLIFQNPGCCVMDGNRLRNRLGERLKRGIFLLIHFGGARNKHLQLFERHFGRMHS